MELKIDCVVFVCFLSLSLMYISRGIWELARHKNTAPAIQLGSVIAESRLFSKYRHLLA